jgi:hypothetical protein
MPSLDAQILDGSRSIKDVGLRAINGSENGFRRKIRRNALTVHDNMMEMRLAITATS